MKGKQKGGDFGAEEGECKTPLDPPAVSVNSSHSFDDGALSLIEAKGQVFVFHARLEDL